MKNESYVPIDILKPFIKTFMIIESEGEAENKLLPDTSITMAFRYRGMVSYVEDGNKNGVPVSVITGLQKSPRVLDYSRNTASLIVRFKEAGAAAFFHEPLHELFGTTLSLDNLVQRRKLREIEERLAEAKNNAQRIALVQRFMLSELAEPRSDPIIIDAVRKIKSANGDIRIKDLVRYFPISRDPFEKRFRRLVGTTPKQFAKIVRLRNLINKYPQAKNLTDAALAAGYFDQAHFIKEFKSFTGQTPRDFFQAPSQW